MLLFCQRAFAPPPVDEYEYAYDEYDGIDDVRTPAAASNETDSNADNSRVETGKTEQEKVLAETELTVQDVQEQNKGLISGIVDELDVTQAISSFYNGSVNLAASMDKIAKAYS